MLRTGPILSGGGVVGAGVGALLFIALPLALAAGAASAQEGAADAPAEIDGETDGEAADAETLVISPQEARACAARLEPMAATFENPAKSIYLRQMGDQGLQVWAPRDAGPSAPLQAWCITTVDAIAEISFLNPANRATIMKLIAAAQPDPPPMRSGDPVASEQDQAPPPTVVVRDEDTEEAARDGGLPEAYQRTPPRGERSAPRVGVPVPDSAGLSLAARADLATCRDQGGEATAVHDRYTGRLLFAECRLADGTALPLPSLAGHMGVAASGG